MIDEWTDVFDRCIPNSNFFSLLLWTFETLSEALSSIVYLAQLKIKFALLEQKL